MTNDLSLFKTHKLFGAIYRAPKSEARHMRYFRPAKIFPLWPRNHIVCPTECASAIMNGVGWERAA
jgi:hypothetical protein